LPIPQLFGADGPAVLGGVRQVLILACGTSYHSGLVARYWLESIAGIPCTVEIASEYRYRSSVPDPATLVIAISQSGETADTLAALKHATLLGMTRTLAICNVPESAIVREAALRFITRAGPEIGVASTKAFTTQLAALAVLTLTLARMSGHIAEDVEARHLNGFRSIYIAKQTRYKRVRQTLCALCEPSADERQVARLCRDMQLQLVSGVTDDKTRTQNLHFC